MQARSILGATFILAALIGHAQSPNDFVTTWQTTSANESITIPTTGGGYNYTVNWGDGTILSGYIGDATHVYATAGTHQVRVSGTFPQLYFNDAGDKTKILDVTQWGNIQWASMQDAFHGCSNLQISATDTPDLSACTSLEGTFRGCTAFNSPLNNWDVSNITITRRMFQDAHAFNQPLNSWDMGQVTNTLAMFKNADAFDQAIGGWDMSQVTITGLMFQGAGAFNQDLSGWDVSQVTSFAGMFDVATAFDQDLGAWDISSANAMSTMLRNTGLSTANYDATLIGWNTLDPGETIPTGLSLGATGLTYCAGALAKQALVNTYGWSINDAGPAGCTPTDEFVTTWQTTAANETITIPTTGTGYDYYVDWGDGTVTLHNDTSSTTDATHAFASAGLQTIRIGGAFPQLYFNDAGDKTKLLDVTQWGNIQWASMNDAFEGCSNLQISATDTPDLSNCTSLEGTFRSCTTFNSPLNNWDVSTITITRRMFQDAHAFNQPLDGWDMGQVTNTLAMFKNADAFDQDIGGWDVSQVTIMGLMFQGAGAFNQDISGWDVHQVTSFAGMFDVATAFDQDLGAWDISSANTMSTMLRNTGLSTANYDATLIGWSTLDPGETAIPTGLALGATGLTFCAGAAARQSLITDHGWSINDAGLGGCAPADEFVTTWQTTTANEPITIPTTGIGYDYYVDWGDGTVTLHSDTSATTDATHTFATAGSHTVRIGGTFPRIYSINAVDRLKLTDVGQWGAMAWKSMAQAFHGCTNLQVSATDTPDLSQCTSMNNMFRGCPLMNAPMDNWDVSTITDMFQAFREASSFDQPLSSWDVSHVTNMAQMFLVCNAFDQDLGDWDISSVTDVSQMLDISGLSTANYDSTLIGWSTQDPGETAVPNGLDLGAQGLTFCAGAGARQDLIDANGWTITDAGLGCTDQPFITTWLTQTANEPINIPTTGSGYDYIVDWGDGSFTHRSDADGNTDASHVYAASGTYTVSIHGTFPRIHLQNEPYRTKLRTVEQWGDIAWDSFASAFRNCTNLDVTATDVPDLSTVTNMSSMFNNCYALGQDPGTNWNWDVSGVTTMNAMFYNGSQFNADITGWDVGNVQDFGAMFRNANVFDQGIGEWDMHSATELGGMFRDADAFDRNLGQWDISNVTGMANMFLNVTLSTFNYDATLIGWATDTSGTAGDGIDDVPSGVTLEGGLSQFCLAVDAHASLINTQGWSITDGGTSCTTADAFITTWQTSVANDTITMPAVGSGFDYVADWGDGMISAHSTAGGTADATHVYSAPGTYQVRMIGAHPRFMLYGSDDVNKIIDVVQWGTQQWSDMTFMFRSCENIQVSASDAPDLSACTSLAGMFRGSNNFNSSIGPWDVSHITNMTGMFQQADAFDQDLSAWDVSSVSLMSDMFFGANAFDRDLSSWDISSLSDATDMFSNSGLSTANYDLLLNGWSTLDPGETTVPSGVPFAAADATFCAGWSGRVDLIDLHGWSITDAGLGCPNGELFVTTWQTTTANESITIPTTGSGYDYFVDWGDGAFTARSDADASTDATHIYASAGSHTVAINGSFPRIYFNGAGDRNKILDVTQWGSNSWSSMSQAFRGCNNLQISATDAPDLSNCTDMGSAFRQSTGFNSPLATWDVSHIAQFANCFRDSPQFDQELGAWDMSSATNLASMFQGATAFNRELDSWDVHQVNSFLGMFNGAQSFDRSLASWNIEHAIQMGNMFTNTSLSTDNYDSILIGWATLDPGESGIPTNLVLGANASYYCAGEAAHDLLTGTYGWTITDLGPEPGCHPLTLSLRAFLQGPYDSGSGLMNDGLRNNGLVPVGEPYSALGYTQVGGGGETTTASVLALAGNDAVVDWVFLELRNKDNNTLVEATRCALLQRDGDVVDVDGTSPVSFDAPADDYYIAVHHRNHLGVMTLNTVALTASPTTVDLTDGSTATYGTNAQNTVSGTLVLWSGNVVDDAFIKYAGANNDRDPILVAIGGTIPTATTTGYLPTDVNMDGTVKYAGANNDRDPILVNIGGTVPTAVRTEQLP
ncbi:MAG: BspA family leucine-rich repeat surface protein [Flavobacteriales bacterium]|nr:BspA family leucine-rich repeat surface protein [Flavobacteriales bacterium]